MTSHCTSRNASWKWPVIEGSATLTAMSSGAIDAPSPTMARPTMGWRVVIAGGAPRRWRVFSTGVAAPRRGSKVLAQERHHPLPRRLGRGRVVGGTPLVGEGVLGVVAKDL